MDRRDYILIKAVKCGYLDGVTLGKQCHMLDRILPKWAHRAVLNIQLMINPSMKTEMILVLESFIKDKDEV